MKLFNALSLNMLPPEGGTLKYLRISDAEARQLLSSRLESYIGHVETANVVANKLWISENLHNRSHGAIALREKAIVAQYIGPRLPEGAIVLPEDSEIRFFSVYVEGI